MHGYDQFIVQVDLTRVMSKLLFLKYLDTTTGFSLSHLFSYSNFMICICSLNSLKIIYKLWRYKPDKMTTSISQTWWYAGLIIPEFLHRDPSHYLWPLNRRKRSDRGRFKWKSMPLLSWKFCFTTNRDTKLQFQSIDELSKSFIQSCFCFWFRSHQPFSPGYRNRKWVV